MIEELPSNNSFKKQKLEDERAVRSNLSQKYRIKSILARTVKFVNEDTMLGRINIASSTRS